MRHECRCLLLPLLLLAATALVVIPGAAAAQCAAGDEALGALDEARAARGVVSDLNLMRAWSGDIRRRIDADYEKYGHGIFDPAELGYRYATSWLWWTDSFEGFSLCETEDAVPVDLDRSWWGAHARVDDFDTDSGYELFWLASTDAIGLPDDLEDFDYAWRHRIAGASIWYRDWFQIRGGTIDVESPSRTGEGIHDGAVYLNLGVPKFGLAFDVLTHPGSRRVNTAMLGVQKRPLPWEGITASATGGWLDREEKAVAGVELSGLQQALTIRAVWEGPPVRLRSATLRVDAEYDAVIGDRAWARAGIAPFVETSLFNSGRFETLTGRTLVPGAATGVRTFFLFGTVAAGVEGFVGINQAAALDRLASVSDHLHWGSRVYVRLGL